MEIKRGNISEIIFHNSENGYTIGIMETKEEQFTVVGCLPSCQRGRSYELTGTFKVHHTYGEQFAFTEFVEIMPESEDGIEGFLASGFIKGIGPKTASLIVSRFGRETLNIIEKQPEKLAEIRGIGLKKAEQIGESFAAQREFADVSMFFQSVGVSADYAMKLYKAYGKDAVNLIEENPYRLIEEVNGFGFRKADIIAEKMGIPKDSPERIKSAISYGLLYFAGEGSTFVPKKELCEKVGQLLEISSESVSEHLIDLAFEGAVQLDVIDNQSVVYLFSYYMAEQKICKNLASLSHGILKSLTVDIEGMIKKTENLTGIALSENQSNAVKSCISRGISVITGGPGTGKTTIINTIINIFKQSGFKTAIAAPTGRAAKRITETSGHYASTIHRLLEYYYSESEDYMKFGKNGEDPLDCDVVIIDEASMIDLMLMNGLLEALKPGTRLILVGDADQLPSVGAGNVLRDIIDSEFVYTIKLTEIFRQAKESLIVVNAHRINHGEYPFCNEKDKDFFMMRKTSEKDMLELIKELVTKRLATYYDWANPMEDIQVLTPVRKGIVGSLNLNLELQSVLNPPREGLNERKFGDKIFRENDKVMQIKNNYQMTWKRSSDYKEGSGVFNGDVGFIKKIDKEFNQVTVIFDDEKYVTYEFSQLDELELAYAVTVHKSQGSEFPIVVMPMTWFPPILATRNLLYTAVTRGKKIVVLVGSEKRMNSMIDNNRITERYSGLKFRLMEMMKVVNIE